MEDVITATRHYEVPDTLSLPIPQQLALYLEDRVWHARLTDGGLADIQAGDIISLGLRLAEVWLRYPKGVDTGLEAVVKEPLDKNRCPRVTFTGQEVIFLLEVTSYSDTRNEAKSGQVKVHPVGKVFREMVYGEVLPGDHEPFSRQSRVQEDGEAGATGTDASPEGVEGA